MNPNFPDGLLDHFGKAPLRPKAEFEASWRQWLAWVELGEVE